MVTDCSVREGEGMKDFQQRIQPIVAPRQS